MKISPYDKVQALKRSKKYHKDYLQYAKERDQKGESDFFMYGKGEGEMAYILSQAGKKLCEKWHLRFPVNPSTPYISGEEGCVHAPVTYLDPPDRWKRTTYRSSKDGHKENITHINGKLVLMIDPSSSTDQIKVELDRILSVWTKRTSSRVKKSKKADIWKIYDEIKDGKKKYQSAKEYAANHTDPGLPQYTTETEVKLIQDSYKKACKIIIAVEKGVQPVTPVDPMNRQFINPTKNK